MQFKQVFIENDLRWVFIFSKREAEVFKAATRNKKSPIDERIIRFVEHRRMMWATDGHQLVRLKAKATPHGPTPEARSWAVEVQEFKDIVVKAKVTELVVLDTTTGNMGTIPKLEVENGDTLTPTHINFVAQFEEGFDLNTQHLTGVLDSIPDEDHAAGVGSFRMSTRFGVTLGALTKATEGASAFVFVAPSSRSGGARWIVDGDDLDGSRWDLVAMSLG